MSDNFSPEAKLLKLIKKQGNSIKKKSAAIEKEPNAKDIIGEKSNKIHINLKDIFKCRFNLSLKKINIILAGIFFVIVIFFIVLNIGVYNEYFIVRMDKIMDTQNIESVAKQAGTEGKKEQLRKIKPYKSYITQVSKQNIFKPLSVEKKFIVSTTISLSELVKDFVLKGIISGDNPQAIIEDRSTGQTFFLYKNDNIKGIFVDNILDGKVILKKDEEYIELIM